MEGVDRPDCQFGRWLQRFLNNSCHMNDTSTFSGPFYYAVAAWILDLMYKKGGVSFHHITDLLESHQVFRVLRENVAVSCIERFSLEDRIPESPWFRLIYPYKSGFFDHLIECLQVFRGPALIVLP